LQIKEIYKSQSKIENSRIKKTGGAKQIHCLSFLSVLPGLETVGVGVMPVAGYHDGVHTEATPFSAGFCTDVR
jgi:hypothetical protein